MLYIKHDSPGGVQDMNTFKRLNYTNRVTICWHVPDKFLIIKISFSLKMDSNFHHFIYNTYLSVLDTVSNRTSLYCKSSSYSASTTWLILDSSFPAFPRMKKRVTSLGAKRSNLIANTENRDCFVIAFLAKTVFSSSMFRWNDEECSIDA